MWKKRLTFGVIVMMLASLACSLPGRGAEEQEPVDTLVPIVTPATQPAEASPTVMIPTAENTATTAPTPDGREIYSYQGVSFRYLPDLFGNFDPLIVDAEANDISAPGWPGPAPETLQINIDGYPMQNTFHKPRIMVYPIQVFAQVNSAAGDISGRLQTTLDNPNALPEHLPFLPLFNAGQMFYEAAEIFPFQNGRGIRYLTCYTQSIIPVDSECLFYTYQGLSNNGNYYISVILPVRLPSLETAEMQAAYEAVELDYDPEQYEAYLEKVKEQFAAASPGDYTPSLDVLDEMMASLRVEPDVELRGPDLGDACAGAMSKRLQPDIRARVTFTDGSPLRLRRSAGKSADILGQMAEGTVLMVTGGPQCVDKGYWWKLRMETGGSLEGWALEGEDGAYYLEPLN